LWAEQLGVAAGLYGLLPLVNALTTPGSALWVTIPSGQMSVAGFDLTMLGAGAVLALTAWRVARPGAARGRRTQQAALSADVADAGALAKGMEETKTAEGLETGEATA
jgi:hypothetical protein